MRSHASTNHRVGSGWSRRHAARCSTSIVDEQGLLNYVNLVVATGQNNRAMNRTVLGTARAGVRAAGRLDEGALNRVEHGIRSTIPA